MKDGYEFFGTDKEIDELMKRNFEVR